MILSSIKNLCLFIVGPTAGGKTALSLKLAAKLSADIISADSRQIYRYMDIGTATPSADELSSARHYFINEKDPDQAYSAGQFGIDARKIISQRMSEGKNIIICGGSGLYVQAILGMISRKAGSYPGIRENLMNELKTAGLEKLRSDLLSRDASSAEYIDLENPKRVIRALEIWEGSGQSPRDLKDNDANSFPYPYVMMGLDVERKYLYERINSRVLQMVEAGLVTEVQTLLKMGYTMDMNALNTVGYKEVADYLQGLISLENAVEDIQKNTRHFAKRQFTWFRKYGPSRENWIDVQKNTSEKEILERAEGIIDHLRSKASVIKNH